MKKIITSTTLVSFIFQSVVFQAFANRINDPDLPLQHCYHWLNERTAKYLTFKYQHASKNGGELTFYTTAATSNGSVAGPGLYCAKTPIGSYSYGDRVVRIDFVDDVVFSNSGGSKTCGTNGRFYSNQDECDKKPVDVLLYDAGSDWYVIKNPQAVKSWSANSDQLINDLTISKGEAPSAGTHFDMTIQAIRAEAQSMGPKTIFNTQARLGLEQILKDPVQLAKIPTLSIIDMVASYSGNKVTDKEKQDLYNSYFDKALKDSVLSFADFSNTLKSNPFLVKILSSRIDKVDYNRLDAYNTATLIAAIDNMDLAITPQKAQALWQVALKSGSSLDTILSAKLKADGVFRKKFDSSLPPVAALMASIKDHNLIPMLKVLNEFADSKSNLKNYTEALFDKILKAGTAFNFIPVFESVKNPALNKEEALADLINQASRNGFTNFDPIGTGLLYDKAKSQFNSQQQKAIETALLSLPIKVDNKLSYQMLEEYKDGKFKLPSFYSDETFLIHLADRSLRERSLGKNTTNTFRMILSGYYFYFMKSVSAQNNDETKKEAAMARASDAFVTVAKALLKKKQLDYTYITLQNGLFFGSKMNTKFHPVGYALELYKDGDAQLDNLIEEAVATSLDPSVIEFLATTEAEARGAIASKAHELMKQTLTYLASSDLKDRLDSDSFKESQAEKRSWSNIIKNARVYSDICSFFDAYDKVKDSALKSHNGVDTSSIEAAKIMAQKDFCANKRANRP